MNLEIFHWILKKIPVSFGKFRILNFFLEDFLIVDITEIERSNLQKFCYFLNKDCLEDQQRNWEIFLIFMKILLFDLKDEIFTTEVSSDSSITELNELKKNLKIFCDKMERKIKSNSQSKLLIQEILEFIK